LTKPNILIVLGPKDKSFLGRVKTDLTAENAEKNQKISEFYARGAGNYIMMRFERYGASTDYFWSYRCMVKIAMAVLLLCCSNVFMTMAWYGHLKNMASKPWFVAAVVSWLIAALEYALQVPANRIGYQVMNVGQLKIIQEVIALAVFVPFSVLYLKEQIRLDYLWAGLCILGAVFFIFRQKLFGC
jgi:hypothetical protein